MRPAERSAPGPQAPRVLEPEGLPERRKELQRARRVPLEARPAAVL